MKSKRWLPSVRQNRFADTVIVGVNKYQPEEDAAVDILEIDNQAVRTEQIDKLGAIRSKRDDARVTDRLAALETGAGSTGQNLLALSIDAMRERATVGEVSDALERAFGRYKATPELVTGVYNHILAKQTRWPASGVITLSEQIRWRGTCAVFAKLGQTVMTEALVIASALRFGVDVARRSVRNPDRGSRHCA